MPRILLRILFRLALCSVAAYLLWRKLGASGLAFSAPIFGVALARPIIELVAEFTGLVKHAALADLQGRNFEHRGQRLDISEDGQAHRWVSVRDVRKIIPSFPRDAVLRTQFPDDLLHDASLGGERIRADALLAYLRKATETEAIKFRNWLERDVVYPAAKIRERSAAADVNAR
ncbi:MAG: hypothetical protein JWQ76_719 [Ramlibacter sp.]|nr:hypothetical protein [Ramlibacter sp.]